MERMIGIDSVIIGAEVPAHVLLDNHPLCAGDVIERHQDLGGADVDERRWSTRCQPKGAAYICFHCRTRQGMRLSLRASLCLVMPVWRVLRRLRRADGGLQAAPAAFGVV
jgi:hypothetical protein